ncbi:hypothetical protein ACLOJK_004764 [Asimina triloba]
MLTGNDGRRPDFDAVVLLLARSEWRMSLPLLPKSSGRCCRLCRSLLNSRSGNSAGGGLLMLLCFLDKQGNVDDNRLISDLSGLTLSDSMEAAAAGDFDLGRPQSRLPAPDLDGRPPDLLRRIYRSEICHGRSDEQWKKEDAGSAHRLDGEEAVGDFHPCPHQDFDWVRSLDRPLTENCRTAAMSGSVGDDGGAP